MRVRLLGGLVVDGVGEREVGSRKGRTLLELLALGRGAPVRVDRIVDVLWGDDPPARPADQVGVLVSRLRGVLGADRLPRTDAGYALLVDWLDIDELTARAAEAASALAEGRTAAARAAADAALALARGPLLPADDGAWVQSERAAADAAVARAGGVAAEAALRAGDADGAVVAASAALARDPFDERALQILMRAHAAAGRTASALAAYREVKERLVEELGLSPSAATEVVHDEVLLAEDTESKLPPAGRGPIPVATSSVVGRGSELDWLRRRMEAAAAGPVLVIIEGEPGIGKTALAGAIAAEAAAGGALALTGRCDELGRDLPLQPILDAVAAGAEAAGLPVPGRGSVAAATTVGDNETGQATLFEALGDTVAALAGERVAVLVVEDLHLAGESTLAWLAHATRRARPLLILATSRLPAPSIRGAAHLLLGPLDPASASAITGLPESDERLDRAAGNPLFLLALASGPAEAVPGSVRDVAAAQVDALGERAAGTVRIAAVLGAEIDLDLVAEVARLPAVEVLGELEQAAAAGLLDEHGSGYAFHHALVREAVEATTGPARIAFIHRVAAAVLDDRPDTDPLAVAVHARLGGDDRRAVDAFLRAAEVAAARFDIDAARSHVESALAAGATAEALAARARLRMATLDYSGAAEDAAAAVALDPGPVALEVSAWIAYYQRRYDAARAHADAAVARAGSDDALRVSALAVAGRVRHGAGDVAAADEQLSRERDGPPPVQGVVDVWLAHLRAHQGRPIEALAAAERALVDAERLAHPWAQLHGRFARVMALGYLGRVGDAYRGVAEMDAAVVRAGAVGARFVGVAANLVGWLDRWCGRWEAAEQAHERARAAAGTPDGSAPASEAHAEPFYVSLIDLADLRLTAGDPDGAAALEDALAPIDSWNGTMAWHQRHRLGLIRSQLALLDGRHDEAAALAEVVLQDAVERGAERYLHLARARLALASDGPDPAVVEATIVGLRESAGLEAWRLTADLAEHLGVDRWRREAEADAARLLASAGGDEDLRRFVASVFA